jgi:Uma2 family endonuclease
MTPATAQPDTLADVVHALGDIPLHRILWHPFPGTATEEDQIRLVDGDPKRLVELIDGILVEKPMGHRESLFAATLLIILGGFVRPRNLGALTAPDAIMRMKAGRNRLPDISFTPWDRLPSDDAHLKSVAKYGGDLMIEILSESNTPAEMSQKRREYFAAGARLVWIIDPDARTVDVYTSPKKHTRLTASDTLTGDPVLPGFVLPLTDLFDDPQLNPRPKTP